MKHNKNGQRPQLVGTDSVPFIHLLYDFYDEIAGS
jgi:hypothetical protein